MNGYKTLFGHLDEILVSKNNKVNKGEMIALMGSTGRSTGPHLHYEVYFQGEAIDPLLFVQ